MFWVERDSGLAKEVVDADLDELLGRDDGGSGSTSPSPPSRRPTTLTTSFGFHPRAVQAVMERGTCRGCTDTPTTSCSSCIRPLRGEGGHVHYLELDLFVGPNYLVTVHGPRNPVVPISAMLTETAEVAKAAEPRAGQADVAGRLMGWIIATLTAAEETSINGLAEEVGGLEKRVMAHMDDNNPQAFLDELFMVRRPHHGAHHGVPERGDPQPLHSRLKHLPRRTSRSSETSATGTGGWTGSRPASWTSSPASLTSTAAGPTRG